MRGIGCTSLWRHRVLLLLLLLVMQACSRTEAPYAPLFQDAVAAAKAQPGGPIAEAFAAAGSATTQNDAARRWEAFLKQYPPNGEMEDAVERRYVDAARFELIRVYYLLGRTREADALLDAADPLGLR